MKTRDAILVRSVRGKYSRWRAGEAVKVSHLSRYYCFIERAKWKGVHPILNQLMNCPRNAVRFTTTTKKKV